MHTTSHRRPRGAAGALAAVAVSAAAITGLDAARAQAGGPCAVPATRHAPGHPPGTPGPWPGLSSHTPSWAWLSAY